MAAKTIRVAAAGDIHASAAESRRVSEAFRRVGSRADLLVLAGDLTQHGEVEEITVVADACREVPIPVVAVLGNHDWQSDRPGDLTRELVDAFGSQWANFGEPLFRAAYAETTRDVEALDDALKAIEPCSVRIALLHYSPTELTLVGEPERLWLVLGAERLAGPIRTHRPDLVVHGHAHAGSFEGEIDGVPVYNVAVHVMGRDFWIFELDAEQRAPQPPVSVDEA
jgi:Icc-related predicted phosphoesterase